MSATRLQAVVRGSLARRQHKLMIAKRNDIKRQQSSNVIQKWWHSKLSRVQFLRIRRAAVRVQSFYRGYRVRLLASKNVTAVRLRLRTVSAQAQKHMTIGARGDSALELLLTHKQLSFVMKACENLDAVTRLSTYYCEKMKNMHAIPIIFQLIRYNQISVYVYSISLLNSLFLRFKRSCNRSKPHMEVLVHAVRILLHVAKHPASAHEVFDQPDGGIVMVRLR